MLKKLNKSGFAHLQLIVVAAIVIIGIGAVGSYVVFKSHAAAQCSWERVNLRIDHYTNTTAVAKLSLSTTGMSYVNVGWGDGTGVNGVSPNVLGKTHTYTRGTRDKPIRASLAGKCKSGKFMTYYVDLVIKKR